MIQKIFWLIAIVLVCACNTRPSTSNKIELEILEAESKYDSIQKNIDRIFVEQDRMTACKNILLSMQKRYYERSNDIKIFNEVLDKCWEEISIQVDSLSKANNLLFVESKAEIEKIKFLNKLKRN